MWKVLVLGGLLAACHTAPGTPDAGMAGSAQPPLGPPPPGVTDNRVPTPAYDPAYLDLFTPEVIIQPGEEKMMCVHLANTRGDLAVDSVNGMQGAGGHHVALFTTDNPQPPGTMYDCTSAESNADMKWFAFNVDFPSGDAIQIPYEFPLVLQFHYLNATDSAMVVRDVERLHIVPRSSVTHPISTLMLLDQNVDVPVGTSSISWDCPFPDGVDIIELFGHMHQTGSKYTLDAGASDSAMTNVNTVDPWSGDFQLHPKVKQYFDAPLHFDPGTLLRTTCTWDNETGAPVVFPSEMCATFAYFYSETQGQCTPPN